MESREIAGYHHPDLAAFSTRVARRLQVIYQDKFSESLVNRILSQARMYYPARPLWSETDMVLIAYGNNLYKSEEKPLQTLHRFALRNLKGIFTCLHILPFFPYTSDDGFSVSDYTRVNTDLGDWDDIAAIAADFELMCDLVINHTSVSHDWFRNFLSDQVPGKDYYIEADAEGDYSQVVRPRSTPLFTSFKTPAGAREVWTTFSADQADLNFANPEVLIEMIRIMLFYISKGVRIIRLDAIAFLWKRKGTSCLHLRETHEIVKLLRDIATYVSPGTILLTETNVPNTENWSYFGKNDEAHMVYQFSLPPLLLHALFAGDARYLSAWAREIPVLSADQTFLNYTASHDGIGVRPLEGILPEQEIRKLINGMVGFGGQVSHKVNPDGTQSPYELNITYVDAMKGDANGIDNHQEERFICSQTIMMSLQGIPAFYFNSLVGTGNDYGGVSRTQRARSINRRQWAVNDLGSCLSSDTLHSRIFKELIRLIRIRQSCSLFHPGCPQEIMLADERVFALKRYNRDIAESLYCISNITARQIVIHGAITPGIATYDLISGLQYDQSDPVQLEAYQTKWLVVKHLADANELRVH